MSLKLLIVCLVLLVVNICVKCIEPIDFIPELLSSPLNIIPGLNSIITYPSASTMASLRKDQKLTVGFKYHLPLPTGPYPNIGYIDIMTGTNKNDSVFGRLLYPAADQSVNPRDNSKKWPNWYPSEEYRNGYLNVVNITNPVLVRVANIFQTNVYIPTVENVEPLKSKGQLPVVIFSHGLASCRTTYSDMCYELVSHGFIVFALEHREQSACVTYYPTESGQKPFEWLQYKHFREFKNELMERNQQLDYRVDEIRRALDLLNDLQNGRLVLNMLETQMDSKRFIGLFDFDNLIVMGHSFGSATAIRSSLAIESVKLGICLDAWMFPLKELDPNLVTKPFLFVNMEKFQTKPNLIGMKKYIATDGNNTKDRKVYTIKGAEHTDQSDLPFIVNSFISRVFRMSSSVDPFIVHDLTTALTLQFIGEKLKLKLKKDKKDLIEKYRNYMTEGIETID